MGSAWTLGLELTSCWDLAPWNRGRETETVFRPADAQDVKKRAQVPFQKTLERETWDEPKERTPETPGRARAQTHGALQLATAPWELVLARPPALCSTRDLRLHK